MKLRVPGSIDGKEVSFAPSVTPGDIPPLVGNDHLIPWGCSIHVYPDECRLEIPSRGIDAKLLVTTSNHVLVNLADFAGMEEPDNDVWTSKRGRNSEETGTESDMTETITDPEEVPAKCTRRGVPRKPRVPRKKPPPAHIQLSPALQSELRKSCSIQPQEAQQHQRQNEQKSQRQQTKALALLLPDKRPRSMDISTVYTCQKVDDQRSHKYKHQDTENEYEIETDDDTQQCDETEQWLSEDYYCQRCEVKARRDAKMCCRILTAFGRREWKTLNDVPLELRKDIGRIHRNLGHASADQLEKLFRDANVSDDAISALKHFRCDACDRLKQPPSKRKVAVNQAEFFNDIVSMDVNFWKISFKEHPREKTTLKVLNIVDAASCVHIAIQVADQTAETIWKAFATGWLRWAGSPRCLRVDPHRSQIARGFFDKSEGRGIFVETTQAEAHWQMGQVENNARYLRQVGYRIVEDIDVSQSDFQTMLDELTDAKNSLLQHNGCMPRQWVFGLNPRVPGHMFEENPDLPNLDPVGGFRKIAEMRHKCRKAAIETEANAKIRTSLIGRSRPMRGNYVPGNLVFLTGEQETVCIKHKVSGWDQLGSLELKEEISGYRIVRQLSSVQRNICVWHHPQSEKCERC